MTDNISTEFYKKMYEELVKFRTEYNYDPDYISISEKEAEMLSKAWGFDMKNASKLMGIPLKIRPQCIT